MPDIIGLNHDALMMRYFETSVPYVIGRERPVFPMNKAGYIIPCALMIKVYPNLDQGIRVVGFLRKIESNSPATLKPKVGEEVIINSLRTHYIMYGGEHDEVYAVSESCYDSFGIPAQITNGNNPEFTIDTIFPEFRDFNDEELKTPVGQLYTIDTTSLPQSFLIGVNSDNSMGSYQNIKDDNLTEKNKQGRYRSAQVRVTLIDDSNLLGNLKFKVLKLVEVAEGNHKQDYSEAHINNDETQIYKESQESPLHLENGSEDEHKEGIEESRSEASNFSLTMGDDMRQLKDMKAKISERRTPASVSFLKTTTLLISALLISLTSVQLDKKYSISNELRYGFEALETSAERNGVLAEMNQYVRLVYGAEGGYLIGLDTSPIKPMIQNMLTHIVHMHFDIIQSRIVQNQTTGDFKIVHTSIKVMQPDGTIMSRGIYGNQAFSIYFGSVQRYIDIPFSEFHSPDGKTIAEQAFYYIKTNGLATLRTVSESVTGAYKKFYITRTQNFFHFFLATMIIGVSFLLAAILIMLPKIFSVNQTNMKVLSLFGYILPEEIQKLANKCEIYMEEYLDEAAIQKEYSSYFSGHDESEERAQLTKQLDEEEEAEEGLEASYVKRNLTSVEEHQNESVTSGNQDFTLQMREFSQHDNHIKLPVLSARTSAQNSPGRLMPSTYRTSIMPSTGRTTTRDDKPLINLREATMSPTNSKLLKDKNVKEDNEEENEELQEYLRERSKKTQKFKRSFQKRSHPENVDFGINLCGIFCWRLYS